MNGPHATGKDFFHASRDRLASPQAGRAWLATLASLACAITVAIGSVGPWVYYTLGSAAEPPTWTMYGLRGDGVFSLLLSLIAIVTLVASLRSHEPGFPAWIAFGALALCAIIGVFDWIIFGPEELTYAPAARADIITAAWGLKLVGIAAPAGAICAFFLTQSVDE